jgi:hypothetical protein
MTPGTLFTLRYLLVFAIFFVVVLPLDATGDLTRQLVLSAATWLFVVFAAKAIPRVERLQFLTMIVVATGYECFGSILWGLYRYRLGNLPMYVPPGHGLFYLAALRVRSLPWVARHGRKIIIAVLVLSGLSAFRGVIGSGPHDMLGLACWFLLIAAFYHGRDPLFFAVSFVLTMALEYYGTSLGTWRWQEAMPYLGISSSNPPSAIGAGYCVIDATTQLALPLADKLARRLVTLLRAGREAVEIIEGSAENVARADTAALSK